MDQPDEPTIKHGDPTGMVVRDNVILRDGEPYNLPPMTVPKNPTFMEELTSLLNRHSWDSKTETPDFILAQFLVNMLENVTVMGTENRRWHNA